MSDFVHGADYLLERSIDISAVKLPEPALTTDGMVSERERRLAYLLARDHYHGGGFIIDGGMMLGSSGVSLAEGVLANPAYLEHRLELGGRRPIVGYELGVLPSNGPAVRELTVGGATIRFGESFAPMLLRNVEPYRDILEVRIGDILNERWAAGDKISILFIDVAKSPKLNQHVFQQFFPELVAGESIVIQQDFFFDRLPWIKVLMGYLSDYFEWIGQVGPSSVYRYVKAIPTDLFAVDPYRDLPKQERIRLHQLAQDPRLPARRRFAIDVSHAYLHAELSGPAAGVRRLEEVTEEHADYIYDPLRGASALTRLNRARKSMDGQAIVTAAPPPRETPAKPAAPRAPANAADPFLSELRRTLEHLVATSQAALDQLAAIDAAAPSPGPKQRKA